MVAFTESQQNKIDKQFAMFVPQEMIAGSDELLHYINGKLFANLSPDKNPSVMQISLQELTGLDRNGIAVQADLIPTKVAALLSGDDNLMRVGLVNPIKIGLSEGQPQIEGGGHRTEALRLIYTHFGFGDRLDEVQVPCFVLDSNMLRVILDNIARGVPQYEKVMIHNSYAGIDISDNANIYDAYLDNAMSLSDTARLLGIRLSDEKPAGLTPETRGKVMVAFVNQVKKQYGKHQFTQVDSYLGDILEFAAEHLQQAVDYVAKVTTLLAHASGSIASYLFTLYKEEVNAGRQQVVEKAEKVAKPKTARPKAAPEATQVEGEEVPKQKKQRKPRAKKVEDSSVPTDNDTPFDASDVVM